LIWFGILNSHEVDFYLIPKFLEFDSFYLYEFPLYLVIIFSIFFGFILGCILENNRTNKIRKSLKEKINELRKSDIELQKLKKQINANRDDVLSLLE
tara:strand:+ start:306 stop:596 length:291 start_codon:yes stop_codon:yes gene_type:complete